MANPRTVKSAFHRELSDYPHEVWHTHNEDEYIVYHVKIYDMSDYDDDDSGYIFDAFERIEDQFDIEETYSDGSGTVTYNFIDYNS